MEYRDFERLATRYSDGEATTAEVAEVEGLLLRDRRAQEDLERIDRESGWVGQAFARPVTDLSRIMIKVRARNPHRKPGFSPFVSLLIQFVLIAAMLMSMAELNSEFAPPRIVLVSSSGDVAFNRSSVLEGRSGISLGARRPIETGRDGYATVQIGAGDTVRAEPDSHFSILVPRPGFRHVVELKQGGVWATFLDAEAGFVLALSGDGAGSGMELSGRTAELDVVLGVDAVNRVFPRAAPNVPAIGTIGALIRVVEGTASAALGNETVMLRPGDCFMVPAAGGGHVLIADPDAAHHRALRLTSTGEFKRSWDWMSPEKMPLSREVVTYPLWRALNAKATELSAKRANAVSRDGAKELRDFQDRVRTNILQARDWISKNPDLDPSRREAWRTSVLLPSPEWMERNAGKLIERLPRLHEPESNTDFVGPDLLVTIAAEVELLIGAWAAGEVAAAPMAQASDVTELYRRIEGMEAEMQQRKKSADRRLDTIARELVTLQTAIEAVDFTRAELGKVEADPRRDAEHKRRNEIIDELASLRLEIERLGRMGREEELAAIEVAPFLDRINALVQQLGPQQTALDGLALEKAGVQGRLDKNTFKQADLTLVVNTIAATRRLIADEKQREAQTEFERRAAEEARNAANAGLANAEQALRAAEASKVAADAALTAAKAVADNARAEVDCVSDMLAALADMRSVALAALNALPLERRADSAWQLTIAECDRHSDFASLAHLRAVSRAGDASTAASSAEIHASHQTESAIAARSALDAATAAQATAQTELTRLELSLASIQKAIADAERGLSEALIEEERLLASKREREQIEAELENVNQRIEPVQATVTRLRSEIEIEREAAKPFQAALGKIQAERAKQPELEATASSRVAELGMLDAIEENERKRRYDLMTAQTERLLILSRLAAQHGGYAAVLGGGARELPSSISEGLTLRGQALSHVFADGKSKPMADGRDPVLLALELGESVAAALSAFVAREGELNHLTRLRGATRLLALQWMAAVARLEDRAVEASIDKWVGEYRADVGIAEGFTEESPKPGTVFAIMMDAASKQNGRAMAAKITPVQMRQILEQQWRLFENLGVMSASDVNAQRAAASARPGRSAPDETVAYLPLLRVDPDGPGMRNIHNRWGAELEKIIGGAALRAAAAARP